MDAVKRPMVSVIMGVYNQWDKQALYEAVYSILNQTFTDFEFIIWNDGSDEETSEVLNELPSLDSRIILAGKDENKGLAFSLNECIKLAQGKYIARMDADDISYITRFEKEIKFLEENKEYSWVGCNTDLFDESGIWGKREMPEFPEKNDYLRFSPFVHPSVMYRASIFDKNEGYLESEETLRCEDYEIFMRFRKAGLKGANLQERLFCYRENDDSYKRRSFKCRINEAKLRYHNFKEMGILFPKGWLYVLRPIVACFVPKGVLAKYKRKESAINTDSLEEAKRYEKRESIITAGNRIYSRPANSVRQ